MKSSDRLIVGAVLLLLAGCATPPAPGEFERATLHGMVYSDQGMPVAWATVQTGETSAVTDIRGRFSIPAVERGPLELSVTAEDHLLLQTSALFTNRTQVLYLSMESLMTRTQEIRGALRDGRPARAADRAREALALGAADPVFSYLLAVAELQAGRPVEAERALAHIADEELEAVRLLASQIERAEGEQ